MVAFDLDGVLLSSEPFVADAYQEAIAAVNARRPGTLPRIPSTREILDHIGWPVTEIQERLFPGLDPVLGQLLYDETSNAMAAHAARGDGLLYPDVTETLGELRARDHQLAIASNARRSYVDAFLACYALRDFFVPPIMADDLGSKARVLRAYLERYALSPTQVVMVGDRANDADAARSAGCHFIGCDYGHGYRHELDGAGPIVDRFADLPPVIERLLAGPAR